MTESSGPKVAGLLLAAGGSSRLGRPKQLVEWEGKTLIRRAAEALIHAGCSPVFVVLGAELERSLQELKELDVAVLINNNWKSGMGASIAVGVGSITSAGQQPDAVLITLCDQPHVTADQLRPFLDAFREARSAVIAAYYNDVAGVPALFSSRLFPTLAALDGKKGAREIIRNSPDAMTIPLPVAAIDVDSPTDLKRLQSS